MLCYVVFAVLMFSTQIFYLNGCSYDPHTFIKQFVLLLIEWATFEATVKFKPVTTHFILLVLVFFMPC